MTLVQQGTRTPPQHQHHQHHHSHHHHRNRQEETPSDISSNESDGSEDEAHEGPYTDTGTGTPGGRPMMPIIFEVAAHHRKLKSAVVAKIVKICHRGVLVARRHFISTLYMGRRIVDAYEDPDLQQAARACVDYHVVSLRAKDFLLFRRNHDNNKLSPNNRSVSSVAGRNKPSHSRPQTQQTDKDLAVVYGLMTWFAEDCFDLQLEPICTNCHSELSVAGLMRFSGVDEPNEHERLAGWSTHVDLYECDLCQQSKRYALRHNPSDLLSSRVGRPAEMANCFTLILRSLGYDAHYVMDLSHHGWVEVWLPSQNRFIHVDPANGLIDEPLVYEAQNGYSPTFLMSFGRYGVVDVTARYTVAQSKQLYTRRLDVGDTFAKVSLLNLNAEMIREYVTKYNRQQQLLIQRSTSSDGYSSGYNISRSSSTMGPSRSNSSSPTAALASSSSNSFKGGFATKSVSPSLVEDSGRDIVDAQMHFNLIHLGQTALLQALAMQVLSPKIVEKRTLDLMCELLALRKTYTQQQEASVPAVAAQIPPRPSIFSPSTSTNKSPVLIFRDLFRSWESKK